MLPHGVNRERILELLEHVGGVTEQSVREVSQATGVPEADVWGAGLFYSLIRQPGRRVRVCDGLTCQMFAGDELAKQLREQGKIVERVSCLGQCDRAPATLDEELRLVTYDGRRRAFTADNPELPINLLGRQDTSYAGLARAREMGAAWVIRELEASGLQGRGGAGFPAHVKWTAVQSQSVTQRYVVCNADESEPGTFKDREIMFRQPHKMLEGLAIAAFVVAAADIYIYIRGEYLEEIRAVQTAIAEAGDELGDFHWHVATGHGAYICGEETALLESLEGKRGMPRLKPPFPTVSGFRNQPTLIHNVETICCIPSIITRGGDWFSGQGRKEPGSKLYCVSGHVQRPGVFELPLGVTLDELAEQAGGFDGTPRAFSPGGASSGFLPMRYRDLPLAYKALAEVGSMLGSAGVVILNDSVDIAQAVAWQLEFFERESCGQCAPCRIGTQYLRRQVATYLDGGASLALSMVDDVGWEMEEGSICGLGMVAAKPLESARAHFPEAFGDRP